MGASDGSSTGSRGGVSWHPEQKSEGHAKEVAKTIRADVRYSNAFFKKVLDCRTRVKSLIINY